MIHSPNHHAWRRAFSWSLIALYFVGVSILIPYALGYRFSFERGVFVYAGSVTLKVNAPDVTIAIDGDTIPDKRRNFINNSYHITGLEPGEHRITLSADGYSTWERNVTVRSGRSTEFWDITLTRTDYPHTTITSSINGQFYLSPNSKLVALHQTIDNAEQVSLSNIANPTNNNFAQTIWSSDELQVRTDTNIEWSPNNDYLLIPTKNRKTDELDFAIVSTTDRKTSLNLRNLAPTLQNIHTVRWSPTNSNNLIIFAQNSIYSLDITSIVISNDKPKNENQHNDNNKNLRKIVDNIQAFTIAQNSIYAIDNKNKLIYRLSDKSAQNTQQITNTPLPNEISNIQTILVYDDNRIALIDENNKLWLLNRQTDNQNDFANQSFDYLGDNIRGAHFSSDGKKLLWWSDTEINVVFVRTQKTQPTHDIHDIINITRLTQPTSNVQWALNDTHILYSIAQTLNLASLDQRGGQSITTITTTDNNSPARLNNNKIYLIKNNTLISIPLTTKTRLFQ